MFYELRKYHIRDGQRHLWVNLMKELILPFQEKMGMKITGTYLSMEDENVYVWIRSFSDEKERMRLYDAVYGSSYWKQVVKPAMGDLLLREKTQVTVMEPWEPC